NEKIMLFGKEEKKVSMEFKASASGRSAVLFSDALVSGGGEIRYLGEYEGEEAAKEISVLLVDLSGIQRFISAVDKLPHLRGSSNMLWSLVNEDIVCKLLKTEFGLCKEQVVFSEGGNLLVLLPKLSEKEKRELNSKVERLFTEKTLNEIKANIVFQNVKLNTSQKDWSINRFGNVLESMHRGLRNEKARSYTKKHEPHSKDIAIKCEDCKCFVEKIQHGLKICKLCEIKKSYGEKNEWIGRLGINVPKDVLLPNETAEIGANIAVIHMDGNMTGRLTKQSLTSADYSFKSEFLVKELHGAVKFAVETMLNKKDSPLLYRYKGKSYLGLDIIYIGGDDILLIINADAALECAKHLTEKVKEKFFFGSKGFSTPTATLSTGIVFAKPGFPVYFLLQKARRLEGTAKECFRKHIIADSEYRDLLRLPSGSIAVSAVTSAMPSGEGFCILLDEPGKSYDKEADGMKIPVLYEHDYTLLEEFIKEFNNTEEGEGRTRFYDVLLSGDSTFDRLNAKKRAYASVAKKKEHIGRAHMFAKVLNNENVLQALKHIMPMLGRGKTNE
ncbi:MAG: hypothetical protein QME12_06100, partial [Nanoarchaeota archaeon]|nr:hypothetical protein [Nanoarchaeota archaeon]